MKSGECLKISVKALVLSLCWVSVLSVFFYYLLMLLCKEFAPFLKPFVFLISIAFFVAMFYICVSFFKTFFADIKEKQLTISKGFLIKRKENLKLSYIVSVKKLTTPFMRFLGLSSLLLIFEGSVCFLPLLRVQDACIISESILKISDKNETI